jgi:hypothetical protein
MLSKSKLKDEIEHVVRSEVSDISFPLLECTRRVFHDDTARTVFERALDAQASPFARSIALSDALKRGENTENPLMKCLLSSAKIDKFTLMSSSISDNFKETDHSLHDLLFEGTDDTQLRIRKNLSSNVSNILRRVLGDSLLCGEDNTMYRSVSRDADVMKTFALEYLKETMSMTEKSRNFICAAVASLSLKFSEYMVGVPLKTTIGTSVSDFVSEGYNNAKALLEISHKWKAIRNQNQACISSQRHHDEGDMAKVREMQRRLKMARRELENASRTQFDESRVAYYAHRVQIAEAEWKRAEEFANSARELRLKNAAKIRKDQGEKQEDDPEIRVVLLYSSNGDVMMDSTLHVAAETGRFRYVRNIVNSAKNNDALVRLLTMRRPSFEISGHTVVAVAASSGREWSDAEVFRWFLDGCPRELKSKTPDLGLELANFGIPLDVARAQMEKHETLDDAMYELVYKNDDWLRPCLGLQLRMTRSWKGCAKIATQVSKLIISGEGRFLQIIGRLLSKRFEKEEKTKKWLVENGRKAVRFLAKRPDLAPAILHTSSQLINLSSGVLSSLGLDSKSLVLGHRIGYCVAMLDLLDLIPKEKNYVRVSKSRLELALRRLGSSAHELVPHVLDILTFVPQILLRSGKHSNSEVSADVSQVLYLLWMIQYEISTNEVLRLCHDMSRFKSVSSRVSKHAHLLHIAARRGAFSSVKSMLCWDAESVLDLDENGKTALHALACGSISRRSKDSHGIRKTARYLLDAGVNMWQRDTLKGQTVFAIPMPLPLLREILLQAVRDSKQDNIDTQTRNRRANDILLASEEAGYAGRLESAALLLFAAALIGRSSVCSSFVAISYFPTYLLIHPTHSY